MASSRLLSRVVLCIVAAALFAGCRQRMGVQPRYDSLEGSGMWADGRSARPPVPGTVARGYLRANKELYTGKTSTTLVTNFPISITKDVIKRGQVRYQIYCSPCHGASGFGDGMIVRRGLSAPPSFHDDRLVTAPVGHFYDVITNGFGKMYDYSAQVPPQDRWAIIAYVRALQFSQKATIDDVPEEIRNELMVKGTWPAKKEEHGDGHAAAGGHGQ